MERTMNYPYSEYTAYSSTGSAVAPAGTAQYVSANIQLASIPERIYVHARRSNATRTFLNTDTAAGISSVNLLFGNESGILSSATQQDLYRMALRNSSNQSWQQFSQYEGSYLCFVPGVDIPLGQLEAAGLSGQYNLKVTANIVNLNNTDTVTYNLYVVVQSEGVN